MERFKKLCGFRIRLCLEFPQKDGFRIVYKGDGEKIMRIKKIVIVYRAR